MNQSICFLSGLGVGAGLMYLMDPALGRRRRALMYDQAQHAWHDVEQAASVLERDLSQRAQGLVAESRAAFGADEADDRVIAERVRSKIGRVVAHPKAIEVTAHNGRVILRGPILAGEVGRLIAAVGGVRGVSEIENRLDVHEHAGNIAALQGGRQRPGQRWEVMQANWSPTTRLMVGAAGAAMVGYGMTQKFPTACVIGTVGLGLMARAGANMEMTRLLGIGGRRAVEVQKTLTVNASPDRVFEEWADYRNFPRFMSHVVEVRNLGGGRSRWTVKGPASIPVSWTAAITRYVPDQIIAWRSEPGSVIANRGMVRFESVQGGTRVHVRLAYNPPGGALGHVAALLFGADPKSAMDDDLVRFKSLIETGKASAPGKEVARGRPRESQRARTPAEEYAPVM